jgi:hypothetical protein
MMMMVGEIRRTDGRARRRVGLAAGRQRSFSIVCPASADSALIREAFGRPVASSRRRFSALWEMKKTKGDANQLSTGRAGNSKNPISFCDGRNQPARSMMHENTFIPGKER